jgi:putative oxidoreductase
MLYKLIQTRNDPLLTLLRICFGAVFFAHGAQKVLGWWGGPGFYGAMNGFTQGMNIPAPLAVLAILAEFLGGICLVAGLLARVAALGVVVNMLVAIFLVHAPYGFFMNWAGKQGGEGFEYHLLAITLGLTLALRGAGAWSLDRLIENGLFAGIGTPYGEPLPHHG